MDDAESKLKKRVLPSWMTEDKTGRKKPRVPETRKKKTEVSPRRRTVYCMNEKELVEYALEILDQGQVQRDGEQKTEAEPQEDKEDPSPDTKGELQEDEEDPSPNTDSERKPPISPGSEKPRTNPPTSQDSDDPLKYVREIFFS